jgi:general secretion pathway protein D
MKFPHLFGFLLLLGALVAPQATAQTTHPATRPDAGNQLVTLNLPDNAPLKVLLDYVSQEFDLNILYDDAAANQRVTIKAPVRVPKRAVPMLLDATLAMKGLALIDAEQPGWKRVVPLAQAAKAGAVPAQAPEGGEGTLAVTQVFSLHHADVKAMETNLKPFLSSTGASSFAVPEQDLLVVTDYASNLRRIAGVIDSIDRASPDVAVKFFPVKHADPARLTQQLEQILKSRLRTGGGERAASAVEVTYDARTSQVAVIAPTSAMTSAGEIVTSLDVDVPTAPSPVRFYKLANTTAVDVLATIRGLEEEETESTGSSLAPVLRGEGRGAGQTNASTGQTPLGAAALSSPAKGKLAANLSAGGATTSSGSATMVPVPEPRGDRYAGTDRTARESGVPTAAVREAIRTKQARITADPNTNSIIVVAPPGVQTLYEQLIRQLDKRRPQVLIECTLVTIDTSGNFSLGVEFSRLGGFNGNDLLTFTQFGLSTPDPDNGRIKIIPGQGFNGALVSTKIADVVIRALEGNTRAKVSSAPRILVNDNNTGSLSSVTEFPYASVNASDTVATTSFGDYSKAGTEISVIPHISEADYLQLEYTVSLSSFTGDPVQQGNTVLPPPRKSDSVQSQVTIPDGSTIIVGGLNTKSAIETIDRVPFVGSIPILEYLFSSRSKTDATGTLFVFIRPVILRDDKFEDLKFMSDRDLHRAGIAGDFPVSEPLTIR